MSLRPLFVMLLAAGVGCSSTAELGPLVAPDVETAVDHFQGSPFSGPQRGLVAESPGEPSAGDALASLAVRGEVFFVRTEAVADWPPLEASARLITNPLAAQPILVRGRLLADVRQLCFAGDTPLPTDDTAVLRLDDSVGALDRGMTCELMLTDPGQPGRPERITLQLHRPPEGGALLAVLSCRRLNDAGQLMDWEQAVLDSGPSVDGEVLAVAIPANDGSGVFVLAARVDRAPDDSEAFVGHAEQVALARTQAGRQYDRQAQHEHSPGGTTAAPELNAALAGLDEAGDPRLVVLYLATSTGAKLARDLALVGDARIVGSVCSGVRTALASDVGLDPSGVAWALDRSGWRALAEAVMSDEPALGLTAVLLRHAGEVGRDLVMLLELLDAADDGPSFDELLRKQNLLFLEENVPASRLRAYDWLRERALAPAGYLPHADRGSRRAALARFRDTGETGP
jgi:hypothetical protein